ncbi:hypothetical protein L3V16_22075 [Brucella ciceri]|uniref:hypothetical protein n=1 Tax=Brucella TaxID=234 RepID=UPI0004696329|nr:MULTISPECIES: hypothetical protein [Brucella]MCH6206516.1 hypothetical protein [Brucella ciceri]
MLHSVSGFDHKKIIFNFVEIKKGAPKGANHLLLGVAVSGLRDALHSRGVRATFCFRYFDELTATGVATYLEGLSHSTKRTFSMTLIFILDSRIPTVLKRWIDLCRKAHRKIDTTEAGCEESRPAFFIADFRRVVN